MNIKGSKMIIKRIEYQLMNTPEIFSNASNYKIYKLMITKKLTCSYCNEKYSFYKTKIPMLAQTIEVKKYLYCKKCKVAFNYNNKLRQENKPNYIQIGIFRD